MQHFIKMTDDPCHENYLAFYLAIITPEYLTPDAAINAVVNGIQPFRLTKRMVTEAYGLFENNIEEDMESIKFYDDFEPHILEIARMFRRIDKKLRQKIFALNERRTLFEPKR